MSQETSAPSEQRRTALIYSPALVQAALPAQHPLKLDRPAQVRTLIESYGLLAAPGVREIAPTPAIRRGGTRSVHAPDYVETVRRLSGGAASAGDGGAAPRLQRVRRQSAVSGHVRLPTAGVRRDAHGSAAGKHEGTVDAAFNPAGGVNHHALPDQASGFGIFNDAAIALAWWCGTRGYGWRMWTLTCIRATAWRRRSSRATTY